MWWVMMLWATVSLLRMAQRRGTRSSTVSACWSRPALYFPLTETAGCAETSQTEHIQATWPNHGKTAGKRAVNIEIVIIVTQTPAKQHATTHCANGIVVQSKCHLQNYCFQPRFLNSHIIKPEWKWRMWQKIAFKNIF